MMKASAFDRNGKTSQIKIEKPMPEKDQILVKVLYSALDPSIQSMLKRDFKSNFLHAKTNPLILGWHFSGVVEGIGQESSMSTCVITSTSTNPTENYAVGDQVWGHLQYEPSQRQGAFSEYIVVSKSDCAKIPGTDPSLETFAAAATESITALQALCDYGGLDKHKPGNNSDKSVLILGAGGGVGAAAVSIAKCLGVGSITGVCSTRDIERVRELGATTVLDRKEKTQQDPFALARKNGKNYDVIFDAPALYSASRALRVVRPRRGTYDATLPSFGMVWAFLGTCFALSKKRVRFVECHSTRTDLEQLGQWLKDGKLHIHVDSTFNVRALEDAYRRQRSPQKVGRVVIKVADGWDV